MSFAITEAEPKSSICSIIRFGGRPGRPAPAEVISLHKQRASVLLIELESRGSDAVMRCGWSRESAAKKHCAAQAEYARLAAQAYSPSDAMSQADIGLDGIQKGSTTPQISRPGALKRDLGAGVSVREGGMVLQTFPVVGDLAAWPHAAGSFGRGRRSSRSGCQSRREAGLPEAGAWAAGRALFLTGWIGLARRDVRSGWWFRPDRFRRSCRLRCSTERREPHGEAGATSLKRLQDGFVGDVDKLLLHARDHSDSVLTGGSGGPATTPKIVKNEICECARPG